MHALFPALDTGYLLKETALDENSVISKSANLRREIDPWNGDFLGNWKLQSPQICFAFRSQASCRSVAGIWSVENDGCIFAVNSSFLRPQNLSKDQQDKLISDAAFLNEIEKNYFDGKISCFSKRGQGYFQNIRESQAPHQLVRRVEVELHSRVTMRTFPA
jgi:hypothetical protein